MSASPVDALIEALEDIAAGGWSSWNETVGRNTMARARRALAAYRAYPRAAAPPSVPEPQRVCLDQRPEWNGGHLVPCNCGAGVFDKHVRTCPSADPPASETCETCGGSGNLCSAKLPCTESHRCSTCGGTGHHPGGEP